MMIEEDVSLWSPCACTCNKHRENMQYTCVFVSLIDHEIITAVSITHFGFPQPLTLKELGTLLSWGFVCLFLWWSLGMGILKETPGRHTSLCAHFSLVTKIISPAQSFLPIGSVAQGTLMTKWLPLIPFWGRVERFFSLEINIQQSSSLPGGDTKILC